MALRMSRLGALLLGCVLAALPPAAGRAAAQVVAAAHVGVAAAGSAPADTGAAVPVSAAGDDVALRSMPFHTGEEMTYNVTLSPFGKVGHGSLLVVGRDTVRGVPTYRVRMTVKGGILFAHVNDEMESWVDPVGFHSLRFHQDQQEVNYKRNRTLEFYPAEMRWVSSSGKSGELATDRPLDDVSFLYFARRLPLQVGETYTFDRYFDKAGNPVILKVLRRDTVTVPAGRFPTIVVQPIIQTKGLFSKGGKAELYFTDDAQRLLVKMKSDVPIIGSLGLELTGYTPGEPPDTAAGPAPDVVSGSAAHTTHSP